MNQQTATTSKTLNPWPEDKKKTARQIIIWDLKTYKAMKTDIEAIENEISEEAAPSATDIRENIYIKSKEISFKGGFNTTITIGHTVRPESDPTVSKAEAIRRYREVMYAATEYREMIRRIKAIEDTLTRLEHSAISTDNLKAKLIKMRFFESDKSEIMIIQELKIDRSTMFRWQNKVIKEIAIRLGFIV